MKKDAIEDLFEKHSGKFDVDTPNEGHQLRFINKLSAINNVAEKPTRFNWKPLIAIAASVLICLSVFITMQSQPDTLELASVSPEMSKTQDFFTATIENELKKLSEERSPFTESIIADALEQVEVLEKEYKTLKTDLNESGKDKRVIYAMVSNFQNRIDILNTVLEQIEDVKQLKINRNEIKNTI